MSDLNLIYVGVGKGNLPLSKSFENIEQGSRLAIWDSHCLSC